MGGGGRLAERGRGRGEFAYGSCLHRLAPSGSLILCPLRNRYTSPTTMTDSPTQIITLGAGCFWCVEAVLLQVAGVRSVQSGFMGGHMENPTYRDICTKDTGHAEVVQVVFEPGVIGLHGILEWFWKLHDPTTLNRQGHDVGSQYRSAIFAHSDQDLEQARALMAAMDASAAFQDPIVTTLGREQIFYPTDESHDDYYKRNRDQGYCRNVIAPKLKKLNLDA
jgi:peptide-methionine (S)-S-oxide reductase